MTKRKKRLEKGLLSIQRQILIHEKKKEAATTERKYDLVKYYEKEIPSLQSEEKRRQEILEKLKKKRR